MKKIYSIFSVLLFSSVTILAQDPCASINTITCGSNITFSQTGAGNINYPNNFGSCTSFTLQGGKEQIYTFTPSTTGTYEFVVSNATGGFVQYLWKLQSSGCDNTSWNCIERVSSTGSVGAMTFNQGVSYYIMLNAESTTTTSQTFTLNCVSNVCSSTLPLNCGVATAFSKTGYGEQNYPNNFGSCTTISSQGGKEQIYTFTPSTTGSYEFVVSTATGGYVQYLYKQVSLGCDNTNWNCIDRFNSTGSVGAITFNQGVSYYIMLNAESTTTTNQTFTLNCATNVCSSTLPLNCGVATAFSKTGYGEQNYPNNIGSCTSFTTQGGKEQIYTFTPSTTGTYEFVVSTATGGYVQYLYKLASLGCDNTNWNCIDRFNSIGSVGAITFNQGVSYYIMLNAESTTITNQTFTINCATNVCSSTLPLNCGVATVFSITGYGEQNYPNNIGSCTNFNVQGGKEQIYTLPASSSAYQINITTSTGGFVQYLWKLQSLGCTNTGWTCLGRKNSNGIITNTIPASTTPIYLMLNSESSVTANHTFQVNCTALATDEFEKNNQLNIYPNPTNSLLNIQTNDNTTIDKVVITDLLGKKLLEVTVHTTQLNVESLAKGTYLIQAYSGEKKLISKFIKE